MQRASASKEEIMLQNAPGTQTQNAEPEDARGAHSQIPDRGHKQDYRIHPKLQNTFKNAQNAFNSCMEHVEAPGTQAEHSQSAARETTRTHYSNALSNMSRMHYQNAAGV